MVQTRIVAGSLDVARGLGFEGGLRGGVVEFQGVVRGVEDGVAIRGIEYECHVTMAETQLRRIAEEVATFYGLAELTVLHRIGPVPAGETSLYVRAVATHRREAFAATEELIVRLKRDVPIWKNPIA